MNQTGFIKAMSQSDTDFAEGYNIAGKDQGMINKQLGSAERFQLNQALEKRGGIRFNYAPTKRHAATKVMWLPFYENPMIVESRKANYASTKVFLRNEPVRLYTGSEARKFKVDIHYSLIHMAAMMSKSDMSRIFNAADSLTTYADVKAIEQYLIETVGRDTGSDDSGKSDPALTKEAMDRATSLEGPWGPNRWWKTGDQPSQGSNYWNFALMWVMRTAKSWVNHHQILQSVVNNIRNSVISTAQMPVKGPPICELKWGTMYNFTPCIVTDYRIQPVENAGYDTKSLTAQRLKVSLSLEEMRNINGNFWGNPEIGGNLPGWDTVLELGTIDPPYRAGRFAKDSITPGGGNR